MPTATANPWGMPAAISTPCPMVWPKLRIALRPVLPEVGTDDVGLDFDRAGHHVVHRGRRPVASRRARPGQGRRSVRLSRLRPVLRAARLRDRVHHIEVDDDARGQVECPNQVLSLQVDAGLASDRRRQPHRASSSAPSPTRPLGARSPPRIRPCRSRPHRPLRRWCRAGRAESRPAIGRPSRPPPWSWPRLDPGCTSSGAVPTASKTRRATAAGPVLGEDGCGPPVGSARAETDRETLGRSGSQTSFPALPERSSGCVP